MILSWKIPVIQKALAITFPVLFCWAFYLDSFRYSMQIRLNGKRSKSDQKLFSLSKSLHIFLNKWVCPSVYSSIWNGVSLILSVCSSGRPSTLQFVAVSVSALASFTSIPNSALVIWSASTLSIARNVGGLTQYIKINLSHNGLIETRPTMPKMCPNDLT